MRWTKWIVAAVSGAVLLGSVAVAQQAPQRGRGQAPGQFQRGQRVPGQFDPAQFRQRMLERMREMLGASEEEWKVIGPLLQDVMEKQRVVRMRGPMMFGPRRGGPGGGPEVPQPVAQLREVLQKENATAQEIKQALDNYRKWRQQQEQALKAAQEKLRQVLTVKQEARLVMMGILD